jgi:hypothetical protein
MTRCSNGCSCKSPIKIKRNPSNEALSCVGGLVNSPSVTKPSLRTCSFDNTTCAVPKGRSFDWPGCDLVRSMDPPETRRATAFEAVTEGWGGLDPVAVLVCLPYASMALLTIVRMSMISRYEARRTMGLKVISMLVIWCDDIVRLSKVRVRSTSSKIRASSGLPIRSSAIPTRVIVSARTSYTK